MWAMQSEGEGSESILRFFSDALVTILIYGGLILLALGIVTVVTLVFAIALVRLVRRGDEDHLE